MFHRVWDKQSLTIQWEGLPRRERERLDRQQHQISSRFRVAEQMRRDSGFSLSVVPSMDGTSLRPVTTYSGRNGSIGNGDSDTRCPATDSVINNGTILPPSDATISSSIDRPRSGAIVTDAGAGGDTAALSTGRTHVDIVTAVTTGISAGCGNTRGGRRVARGGHGDDKILHIPTDRARLWGGDTRVDDRSVGVAAGKSTPCHVFASAGKALKSVVMSSSETRRGKACGVADAGIANGLSRSGRPKGPSFGVVGIGGSITFEE